MSILLALAEAFGLIEIPHLSCLEAPFIPYSRHGALFMGYVACSQIF